MADNMIVLGKEKLEQYERDGYVAVENFLSPEEVDSLRAACDRLVTDLDPAEHQTVSFSTIDTQQSRGSYFITSGDKVRYFFEEDALDKDGNLKVAKELSLNKIGHALHWLVPEFRKVSFSAKVKAIARELQYISPALVQSMYIFKQPNFGGQVTPHKDCTFLSTEPQSCTGLWMPLEDATLENGCLWCRPGSQNTSTERRFIRTQGADGQMTTKMTGPVDEDDPRKYIAAPVKKGSLVIINGSVDHKSARNTSSSSRHAYTFHIIETRATTWDPNNWLQPTQEMPFTNLYDN